MKIVSIDVGIKNLALCLFEVENKECYEIRNWDVAARLRFGLVLAGSNGGGFCCRVEGGIFLCWHGCFGLLAPLLHSPQQFGRLLGIGRGQILRLADVLAKVVKFQPAVLEILMQFPIADANYAARPRSDNGSRCSPSVRYDCK